MHLTANVINQLERCGHVWKSLKLYYEGLSKFGKFYWLSLGTGKSLSEASILAPTNPQYDNRLFIKLRVQYKKTTSSVHVYTFFLFWHSEHNLYTTCTELVVFMYWTRNSMNNLLSHCGLVDARIKRVLDQFIFCGIGNLWKFWMMLN